MLLHLPGLYGSCQLQCLQLLTNNLSVKKTCLNSKASNFRQQKKILGIRSLHKVTRLFFAGRENTTEYCICWKVSSLFLKTSCVGLPDYIDTYVCSSGSEYINVSVGRYGHFSNRHIAPVRSPIYDIIMHGWVLTRERLCVLVIGYFITIWWFGVSRPTNNQSNILSNILKN